MNGSDIATNVHVTPIFKTPGPEGPYRDEIVLLNAFNTSLVKRA